MVCPVWCGKGHEWEEMHDEGVTEERQRNKDIQADVPI
jgi:hypothetical protein